jgi:hypothetical protein
LQAKIIKWRISRGVLSNKFKNMTLDYLLHFYYATILFVKGTEFLIEFQADYDFMGRVRPYLDDGRAICLCPGTASWNRFVL